jgi:signal transduction histidine kinase
LLVHGRPRGALIFVSEVPDRYTSKDLRFAEEVAARAALALDQARLYEEVQRAVMTRDDFLVSASHDLRNPLSAIRVTAQALQLRASRDGLTDSRQLRTALEIIDSAAGRMAGLISGLLDVARLQHGEPLDLAYDSVDLVPFVRQMVTEAQQGSPRHQIQLEADQSMVGSWDPERLQRLLGNLLDNAVKYSPDGGAITITLRLGIERGSEAILTVSDDGVGIPAADLPRVFERFRRGGNVVGRVPGNGIGLAGARQIVEQHGGTISVTSQEGHGTTVTVRLPLSAPGLSTDGSHRGEAETTTDGVVAGAR